MAEILKLVNDTTEIDLLDYDTVRLIKWEPELAPWKEISTNPYLSDGQNLVFRNFDDSNQVISVAIISSTQNDASIVLANLTNILELGVAYELGVYPTPTYLVMKPGNVTNTLYARVKKYKIEKIPQVFGDGPFEVGGASGGKSVNTMLEEINIGLTLDRYSGAIPGSLTTVPGRVDTTFNGDDYGSFDLSGNEIFEDSVVVSSMYSRTNISHIYRFDSSAGTYSTNLASSTSAFNLFPSPMGAGDILYIGVQSSLTNAAHLSNLVFNISSAAAANTVFVWEVWYQDGATWIDVTPNDTTSEFTVLGKGVVSWVSPLVDDGNTTSINGVTAYWVRCRVTTLGTGTVPVQGNFSLYSAVTPIVKIAASAVTGTLPALAKFRIHNVATLDINRIILGTRSLSKGVDFGPIWNYTSNSSQNPDGISSAILPSSGGTSLVRDDLPAGRATLFTAAAVLPGTEFFKFTISGSYVSQYYGRFKCFLNVIPTSLTGGNGVTSELQFRLKVKTENETFTNYTTDYKSLNDYEFGGQLQGLDMGEHEFFPYLGEGVSFSNMEIITEVKSTLSSVSFIIVSLVLVPVDEYSFDVSVPSAFQPIGTGEYLEVDGTGLKITGAIKNSANNNFIRSIPLRSATRPKLRANEDQILVVYCPIKENEVIGQTLYPLKIETQISQGYLTPLRGNF